MASPTNRKRTHKRNDESRSTWGFLFNQHATEEELGSGGFFNQTAEEEETSSQRQRSLLSLIQGKISLLSLFATVVFILFSLGLGMTVLRMWIPQNLNDIAGYGEEQTSRDLKDVISRANGAPVTITEAELNHYLRETCRMSQTGIFSIVTQCKGIAVRVHEGYVEVVFDRIIGSDIHQTTSAFLTFSQKNNLGRPELEVEFRGGAPLFGAMPTGGTIGQMPMPQRHIRMLKPALESMLLCYPEIIALIERYHYCPVFTTTGGHRITLIPYSPS